MILILRGDCFLMVLLSVKNSLLTLQPNMLKQILMLQCGQMVTSLLSGSPGIRMVVIEEFLEESSMQMAQQRQMRY